MFKSNDIYESLPNLLWLMNFIVYDWWISQKKGGMNYRLHILLLLQCSTLSQWVVFSVASDAARFFPRKSNIRLFWPESNDFSFRLCTQFCSLNVVSGIESFTLLLLMASLFLTVLAGTAVWQTTEFRSFCLNWRLFGPDAIFVALRGDFDDSQLVWKREKCADRCLPKWTYPQILKKWKI